MRHPNLCPLLAALLLAACGAPKPPSGGADAGGLGQDGGPTERDGGPTERDGGPGPFTWPVPQEPVQVPASSAWRDTLAFPDDPFANSSVRGGPRWVKFTVLLKDPSRVYFQDSNAYPFHYHFAKGHLPPYAALTDSEFDAVTLHEAGQEAVLGAVLLPPVSRAVSEVGIQLVRQDAYHPELVRILFEKVRAAIQSAAPVQAFYFPTFEQLPSAERWRGWLEAHGVLLGSVDRWSERSLCYSPGWSFGRLVQLPGAEVETAYADGRLTAADLLLTDGVPAELPALAGILTTRPSTPNSHVAILAATTRTPFAYLASPAEASLAAALAGREVILRMRSTSHSGFECQVELFPLPPLSPSLRTQLAALKAPPTIDLIPKAPLGALHADTLGLGPADLRHFGGKAANFGLLRRGIPDNTFFAIAFSFDLWDEVMAQPVTGGRTLAQEVAARLAPFSSYPPDLVQVKETLAGIRLLIRNEARFPPHVEAEVVAALAPFSVTRNIRFRSSTNVEDAADFTGAGLYDSYSGCLQDDLDADAAGPSACDPTEAQERGVFRALRRVFASFYNDNAFLERLRHGVDESKVGMAVLVHHSTPDAEELANGVATVTDDEHAVRVVTQKGAQSVTNPSGTALAEVVTGFVSAGSAFLKLEAGSSLVPLGATVMSFPDDYATLARLLTAVKAEFRKAHPAKDTFLLDFEFKKLAPEGRLVVKQVREVPQPDEVPSLDPFLLNVPLRRCTLQGEAANALALHRLKARVSLEVKSLRLTADARQSSVLETAGLEVISATGTTLLSGPPTTWPGFVHTVDGQRLLDSFQVGEGSLARELALGLTFPEKVASSQSPILVPQDGALFLRARYSAPQPTIFKGSVGQAIEESAPLVLCPEDTVVTDAFLLQERRFEGPGDVVVETSFYWPPEPTGIVAGYTAPLAQWVRTEIRGLTSAPLVLSGYWSQTYRPGHHNFSEGFVFEPAREEGVTPEQRAELSAKDIQMLHLLGTPASFQVHVVGLDGAVRVLE